MKPSNTIIIGMKHVGKTAYAKTLAQQTGHAYIATDDLVVTRHNQTHDASATSAREVHKAIGQDAFRALEEEVVKELSNAHSTDTIIDTGGGIVLSQQNRTLLPAIGRVIYLHGSAEMIVERILKGGVPSFVPPNEDPKQAIRRIYDERDRLYREIADVIDEV